MFGCVSACSPPRRPFCWFALTLLPKAVLCSALCTYVPTRPLTVPLLCSPPLARVGSRRHTPTVHHSSLPPMQSAKATEASCRSLLLGFYAVVSLRLVSPRRGRLPPASCTRMAVCSAILTTAVVPSCRNLSLSSLRMPATTLPVFLYAMPFGSCAPCRCTHTAEGYCVVPL